ncbi:MAG: hypothetical protein VB035_12260 [Candidatus Fimivivens sp.]|nr:hypothetical protein [Candidatus Fimivivens sp.]
MVNYNNSADSIAMPTPGIDFKSIQFPLKKNNLQPTKSLLEDMCKVVDSQPSARLSVSSLKRPSAPVQPSYSAAFALPVQAPGQLTVEPDRVSHQNLSVSQKERSIKPAIASKPRPDGKADHKLTKSGCSLTPCSHEENMAAVYPQAEALSTIISGQPINFGDALFTENSAIEHKVHTDTFLIKEAGIYELHYSLNYEASAPSMLIFGIEGFPQSYSRQKITTAPSRGKLTVTGRLLLDTGTVLRLSLINDASSSMAQRVLVSNAMLEIKLLYQLKFNCPVYSTDNPEKNFQV